MYDLHLASAILLAAFAGLAAIDGLFLHLWRYRLHAVASARKEHLLHTIHAVLFIPMLLLVFNGQSSGVSLWLGGAVALAGLVVVAWDSVHELTSRRFQGGLPPGEATLHALLHTLQIGAVVLSLAARPVSAWSLEADPLALTNAGAASWVAMQVLPGAIIVALVHIALLVRPALLPARGERPQIAQSQEPACC